MSNTIYSAILPVISKDKNKYNYVYQITEISTGMKYIGSRGTKQSNPLKDLKKYKSSTFNSYFELNQKLNPLNYHYEILSYHSTRNEATLEESRLHFLYDVKSNPKYYNRSNQTANGFSTAGKAVVKDNKGNIALVNCDDPRYLSGELVGITKGNVTVRDNNGNKVKVSVNDTRLKSGELKMHTKGKAVVKDKYGNTFQVDINDSRLKSGELTGHTKGMVPVKDKYGNNFQVPVNDLRYLSGSLVHISVGKTLSDNHKKKISDKTKGDKNPAAKAVFINGNIYSTIRDAIKILSVSSYIITTRCKSTEQQWDQWYFI